MDVTPNPIYSIHNPVDLKYLTRLRVGLSHLRVHKYQYNFSDTNTQFCSCQNNKPETVEHYLLHCSTYSHIRSELFQKLRQIISLVTFVFSSYILVTKFKKIVHIFYPLMVTMKSSR